MYSGQQRADGLAASRQQKAESLSRKHGAESQWKKPTTIRLRSVDRCREPSGPGLLVEHQHSDMALFVKV